MTNKVLYLDFDGVLHDERVYFDPSRGIHIKTPGRTLFEWSHILEALLAPYAEVKIVLSTSWVRVRSLDFATQQLCPALRDRVIGGTFHEQEPWFAYLPRGEQIAEDVSQRKPDAWFAIDDDDIGWPKQFSEKLIKTDGAVGINDTVIQGSIQKMLQRL